jgi:chemosensory pili system protein ChpC
MSSLPTYVVSMQKQGILLPQAVVAEIIPYEPLQRVEDTPDWFLGLLGWRGVQVPVASFEMLTVERASFSLVSVSSACLVIVKGLSDQVGLPYYATVAQTEPRLIELLEEMLIATGEMPARTETDRVRFEDAVISVPDLDFVEASILEFMDS